MKVYESIPDTEEKDSRIQSVTKFARRKKNDNGRGRNVDAKLGNDKRLAHRQDRKDEKRFIQQELEDWDEWDEYQDLD